MSPRQRTFVIFGVIIVGLAAIIYVVSSNILLNGFAALEAQSVDRDAQRVQEAIANELASLDRQAVDWSNWDDAYVFVHEGREIKLCCKSCLKDFKKDPAKYIKKIEAAEAKAKKAG